MIRWTEQIVRDKHTSQSVINDGGYACTSNHISQDTRLNALEYAICEYILHKPDDWAIHKCEIKNRFMEGKVDIDNAWNNLQKYGYITHNNKKGNRKVWTFHETPIIQYGNV